jgi:hypothetical protein
MFGTRRRSHIKLEPVELDTSERIEALGDAFGNARDRVQDLSAALGRRASRRRRRATRASAEAARAALEQARAATDRLPDRDELMELTRRAGDRLFRERARARRKAQRRRRRGRVYRTVGLAGAGVAIGWLTAPRRGAAADRISRTRSGPASDPIDMRVDPVAPVEVPIVPQTGAVSDPASSQDGGRAD